MSLILPQTIKTNWNSKFVKYYQSKGYQYTKIGDELEVNVLDLPLTSQIQVKALCNYCGKELNVQYFRANPGMKVSCIKCRSKRTQEEYGYSSTWQLSQTKETIKNTFVKNYGVDHNFKSKEIQEKRKQTFINKYGVEYITQSLIIQEKIKQTNLNNRGYEYVLSDPKVRNKIKNTNIEKYGVDNPRKNKKIADNIRIKANQTLYKNSNGPSSQQQRYLHNLLGGELNYPVDRCMLDIAFINEMIYLEYDGGGHNLLVKKGIITNKQFSNKELKRKKFLQLKGWKLIKYITSKDILLNDDKILELIQECKNYLLNSNHTWIEINIDENKIKCKEYERGIYEKNKAYKDNGNRL